MGLGVCRRQASPGPPPQPRVTLWEDLTVQLLSAAFQHLRTILQDRVSPKKSLRPGRRPSCRPQVEGLEARTLLNCGPLMTIDSVHIAAQHANLRVGAHEALEIVLQITGKNSARQEVTLQDTAAQLLGMGFADADIRFHVVRGNHAGGILHRHVFQDTAPGFTHQGVLNVLPGPVGFGEGIQATVCGVFSQRIQIVRGTAQQALAGFQGAWVGSYSGTYNAGGQTGPVPAGAVHFVIAGRTARVDQPGTGSGTIFPNGTGNFVFGNGGLTINGIPGSATFHAGLTLLSTFQAFGGGSWSFSGTFSGRPVTASGSWSATKA